MAVQASVDERLAKLEEAVAHLIDLVGGTRTGEFERRGMFTVARDPGPEAWQVLDADNTAVIPQKQ